MPRYKLTIEYDGSGFVGWQRQENGFSVQQALEEAIAEFSGQAVTAHGAGRTDSGVHALGQVVHIDLDGFPGPETVRDAMNFHLKPAPVAVLTAEKRDALIRSLRRDGSLLGLRDLTGITMLSDTGLRANELLNLTVEGIDVQQRRAIIMGKGARERVIGLEPGTLRLLRRYWRRAGITEGAILRSRTGGPLTLSGLYLAVRRRGQQSGIDSLHPHVFRHGTATALLKAGVQEADVRLLLGWSRGSRMLERYTKSTAVERALEARQAVRLVR